MNKKFWHFHDSDPSILQCTIHLLVLLQQYIHTVIDYTIHNIQVNLISVVNGSTGLEKQKN